MYYKILITPKRGLQVCTLQWTDEESNYEGEFIPAKFDTAQEAERIALKIWRSVILGNAHLIVGGISK